MAAPNLIYRGPAGVTPVTINRATVDGALLPGTFVELDGGELKQITSLAPGKRPLILGIADYAGQHPDTAYANGDTGVAYQPRPQEVYSVAMAAGTYAAGAPVTIAANGRAAAADGGAVVVGYFTDRQDGSPSAGDRRDIIVANFVATAE